MIPKKIHLCWFSGDEFPADIKFCIDSWRRVLPDFEIKVWTKEMALAIGMEFVREAISVKKWAFAADVFLYSHRGELMEFVPNDKIHLLPEGEAYSLTEKLLSEVLKKG